MNEEEDLGSVADIKRDIYAKHLPQALPRKKEPEKIDNEEAQRLMGENREYRTEIEKLKNKVKELFRENNQLREYVSEMEGKLYPEDKKSIGKQKWQNLLGL